MTNENKLLKDTLLYGVAHFGSSALSFLMLPIYTRYFSPAEFGTWDLAVTTIALLAPFITFELVAAAYRWLLDAKTDEDCQTIISTSAFTIARNLILLNSVVVFVVIMFSLQIPYIWEALIFINLSIMSSFIQQCARGLRLNILFASIGIIQSVIIVAFNLVFMFGFNLRVEALFYSAIIAHLSTIIFAWTRMNFSHYISKGGYSRNLMKDFLVYSLPIVPGAVSWWVMTMSDRYMIIYFLGVEYNGIYAIANKIPAILLMLNTIFFLAWKDSAITEYNSAQKNAYYSTVFRNFFRLMATAVICLTIFTKPVLSIAISADYFSSWKYIGLLLIGALFHTFSLFWSAGYHGAKKTNVILVTSVVGALINIIVNFIFIPLIGLYAVALSSILSFLLTWIIRVVASKPYFQINIRIGEVFILFSIIIVANIVPFQFSQTELFLTGLLALGLLFILNRNLIVYGYKTVMKIIAGLRN